MAKLNDKYEAAVVFTMKQGEEAAKAAMERFSGRISRNATLDSIDEWGKRTLAYEIDDQTEGYYVFYSFTSNPSFPAELERRMKISESVLRYMITTKE